jgi:hypothetical protein
MELVNYLYGWYTNTEHTTWYRDQEEVVAEEIVAQEEGVTAPVKRGRKPKTT